MIVCKHCGWENPEEAAFCTNCGRGLGRAPVDRSSENRFRALGDRDSVTPAPAEAPPDMPTLNSPPPAQSAPTLLDFRMPEGFLEGGETPEPDGGPATISDLQPPVPPEEVEGEDPPDPGPPTERQAPPEPEAEDDADGSEDEPDEALEETEPPEADAEPEEDEAPAAQGEAEPEDEAEPEAEAEAQVAEEPEAAAEPEGDAEVEAADEPEVQAEAEPDAEPEVAAEQAPEAEAPRPRQSGRVELGAVARAVREAAAASGDDPDMSVDGSMDGSVHSSMDAADTPAPAASADPGLIPAPIETLEPDAVVPIETNEPLPQAQGEPVDEDFSGLDEPADEDAQPSLEDSDGPPPADLTDAELASAADEVRAALSDNGGLIEPLPAEKTAALVAEDVDEVEEAEALDSADLEPEELAPELLPPVEEHADDDPPLLSTGEFEALPDPPAGPPPIPKALFLLRPLSTHIDSNGLVPIGEDPLVVGRKDADIRLGDDPYISPRHARFTAGEDGLYVEDLDSLNGVWLRVRREVLLRAEDELMVGRQVLRVQAVAPREAQATEDGTKRAGARTGARFRVVRIGDDGEPLDVHYVTREGSRVGRHVADLVFPNDTYMSGTHALLRPAEEGLRLRDLSSRNGTWIRVRGKRRLTVGDAVGIGQVFWRVSRSVG